MNRRPRIVLRGSSFRQDSIQIFNSLINPHDHGNNARHQEAAPAPPATIHLPVLSVAYSCHYNSQNPGFRHYRVSPKVGVSFCVKKSSSAGWDSPPHSMGNGKVALPEDNDLAEAEIPFLSKQQIVTESQSRPHAAPPAAQCNQ